MLTPITKLALIFFSVLLLRSLYWLGVGLTTGCTVIINYRGSGMHDGSDYHYCLPDMDFYLGMLSHVLIVALTVWFGMRMRRSLAEYRNASQVIKRSEVDRNGNLRRDDDTQTKI